MRESQIQSAIMDMLTIHPRIAWATVMTTGKVRHKGYWISMHFPGMADILFQTKQGRLGAIEVKVPGQAPTREQLAFLSLVESNGGLAGWADSVEAAQEILR